MVCVYTMQSAVAGMSPEEVAFFPLLVECFPNQVITMLYQLRSDQLVKFSQIHTASRRRSQPSLLTHKAYYYIDTLSCAFQERKRTFISRSGVYEYVHLVYIFVYIMNLKRVGLCA